MMSFPWFWGQPDNWPRPLRWSLLLLVATAAALVLGQCSLPDAMRALKQAQAQEAQLREDFRVKFAQALLLDSLRQRRQQLVAQMEAQTVAGGQVHVEQNLAGRVPMNDLEVLLSQINRAGRQHDLRFELFRPGPFVTHPYYVEMPITLRVTGRYHDIGAFAADLASHPRMLVLDLLTLNQRNGASDPASDRGSLLTLEAVVKAYRAAGPDDQPVHKRGAAKGGRP